LAVFLVVAGLTGSVLAYYNDLDALASHDLHRSADSRDQPVQDPIDVWERLRNSGQLDPGTSAFYLPLDPKPGRAMTIYLARPEADGDDEIFVDPHTGEVLGSRRWGDLSQGVRNLVPFVYRLHYSLGLGEAGVTVMGIVALAWTFDCFVGAYLTLPRSTRGGLLAALRRWRSAWTLRGRPVFAFVFTSHRAFGLWAWALLFIFAWSAVGLNLNAVYRPVVDATLGLASDPNEQLGLLSAPRMRPRLGLHEARARGAELLGEEARARGVEVFEAVELSYHPERGVYRYQARTSRDITRERGRTTVFFDGDSGASLGFTAPTGERAGSTLTTWLNQLHFGAVDVGGAPYRALVCVAGIVVAWLSASGVWIWWKQRRSRAKLRGEGASRARVAGTALLLGSGFPEAAHAEPPTSGVGRHPLAEQTPAPAEPPQDEEGEDDEGFEVNVRGRPSAARERQDSSDAVTVVDLSRAREQTADLGEVVARTQGASVRRSGGLGSDATFSLNGFTDDQVRLFLDGVPLDVAGFPFGLANVHVNLVDRIEIYRGVVPIRLGADALGGAVDLVTSRFRGDRLGASLQTGSFGTLRLSADAQVSDEATGLFTTATAFLDAARNDYEIDVEIPDDRGRLSPSRVRRFHDAYVARGASVEVGVAERPWAKRLSLRVHGSSYDKELQHNVVMTVPYGEVRFGEVVLGATGRYEVDPHPDVALDTVLAYARRTVELVDRGRWIYDWRGRRVRERGSPGEIDGRATEPILWQDSLFARSTLTWSPHESHALRLSVTPSFATRIGEERAPLDEDARDPLAARSSLMTFVSGVEHELSAFPNADAPTDPGQRLRGVDYALVNSVFAKAYLLDVTTRELLPGAIPRALDRTGLSFGAGDAVRARLLPWLLVKASYEFATRLPRPDEVFGDGILILPNLELEPEISHNANLGPRVEARGTAAGTFTADLNAFLRASDRLIVLLGNDRFFSHQNVLAARSMGVEGSVGWVSPERFVALDGTVTFQDFRNTSDEGVFGAFEGDRIPNRPWLFASWGARGRIPTLPGIDDALEPFYLGRYVHGFDRGWESQGLRDFKQVVDAQLVHDVGLTWTVAREHARVTSTFEIQNVADAAVFDFFGVQRPGRAFFLKVTGQTE
jgi:uncharacterized iron-regulated membrane protein